MQTQQLIPQINKEVHIVDMTQIKYCKGCKMNHHISEFSESNRGVLKDHCRKAAGAILTLGKMQRQETKATEYHKKCIKCEKVKHHSKFYAHSKAKDGLQSECKICRRKYNKERAKQGKANAQAPATLKMKKGPAIQAAPVQKPVGQIKVQDKTLEVTQQQLQVLLEANSIARALGVTLELGKNPQG